MPESPLSKIAKDSLQRLFNLNPRQITDKDLEELCTVLRTQRTAYLVEESKPRVKKQKADPNLSLEDLDL